jgi:hypothetical protein
MGQIHIHRQGNLLYYEHFQEIRHSDCPPLQKYHGSLLTPKKLNSDIYAQSGIYKLTCPDCDKAYVGQTGRKFSERYREHRNAYRNNNHTYSFARHLNDTAHSFGPINEVMQVIQCHKKGPHLNTIEKFHIHTKTRIITI